MYCRRAGPRTMSTPRRVEAGDVRGGEPDLMTIGELASRTGLSRKLIRDFEDRGLIYSAGRSEAGYRLFDQSALWCVTVIGNQRSLGLTLKEIQQLAAVRRPTPTPDAPLTLTPG